MSDPETKPLRPLWREPVTLGIAGLVALASAGVFLKDRFAPGPAADPNNKAAMVPGGGGSFCDLPVPVKSTAYNPSTRPSD